MCSLPGLSANNAMLLTSLPQAPEAPLPSRFRRPGTRPQSVYLSRRHSRKASRRFSLRAKSRRASGSAGVRVTSLQQEPSVHIQDGHKTALNTAAEVVDNGWEGEEEETNVSFLKVLRLSSREWWLLLLGVLGSVVDGAVYPVFAIIFGEALEVFSLPASQVIPNIHKWAGLFLVLGVVSGISVFIKVGRISGWGHNGRGSDPLGDGFRT